MSYKISKELFEKVMNVKLTTDLSIAPYYNEVNGCEEEDLILINYNFIWIPLDTFFFKCKEWALRQGGLTILSGTYKNTVEGFLQNKAYIGYAAIQYYVIDEYRTGTYCLKTYDRIKASCERQAVFDICQRILNNKEK